jgi:hypothetical protein
LPSLLTRPSATLSCVTSNLRVHRSAPIAKLLINSSPGDDGSDNVSDGTDDHSHTSRYGYGKVIRQLEHDQIKIQADFKHLKESVEKDQSDIAALKADYSNMSTQLDGLVEIKKTLDDLKKSFDDKLSKLDEKFRLLNEPRPWQDMACLDNQIGKLAALNESGLI